MPSWLQVLPDPQHGRGAWVRRGSEEQRQEAGGQGGHSQPRIRCFLPWFTLLLATFQVATIIDPWTLLKERNLLEDSTKR